MGDLIGKDNNRNFGLYSRNFYEFLEKSNKAVILEPHKRIPEIITHHWKTISKLVFSLVDWLKLRIPTKSEKVVLIENVLNFLSALMSDKYSFPLHPLPPTADLKIDLPSCFYHD